MSLKPELKSQLLPLTGNQQPQPQPQAINKGPLTTANSATSMVPTATLGGQPQPSFETQSPHSLMTQAQPQGLRFGSGDSPSFGGGMGGGLQGFGFPGMASPPSPYQGGRGGGLLGLSDSFIQYLVQALNPGNQRRF